MHVLTLIGCVLFSDVGLGDGLGGGAGCVSVHTGVCACGLDEPPEFTLQLWSSSGGRGGK